MSMLIVGSHSSHASDILSGYASDTFAANFSGLFLFVIELRLVSLLVALRRLIAMVFLLIWFFFE